jgi:hypothetical protein
MSFDPQKITFFAKTDARGKGVPFGIRAIDRQRHMYIIGKTGMGKSTMLENMAVQDIQNGEGMAFIDPHGATAEKLLDYVPEHRIQDVVYFAPFDMEYPISFNVMEDVGPDKRHLVVSGLMSTFKKIWVDQWSARMEYILTNTLLALLEYPGSTLLCVNRMLADKDYRKIVVDNINDPAVKSFWVDEYAKYTDRFAAEAIPAIQNKIGQFTGNPLIRNIIGQPKSSFDIRKIMDEKKILIMNLSKGLVGETNANLLGSMLTTSIYLAAMSRADLSAREIEAAPNFYFYVDEFQSFANTTFANILSEARKYKLNLTIAHQYIEQMEEEVRDAVFGNVGTTIAFRVGPLDAELLETIFTPKFLAADIVNLGLRQIYLTLMIDGMGSQPFSATTLPPIEVPRISYKDMVIAASREQFGHYRTEVEEKIVHSMEPEKPPERTSRPPETKSSTSPRKPEQGFTRTSESREVAPKEHISRERSTPIHNNNAPTDQRKGIDGEKERTYSPRAQERRPERKPHVSQAKKAEDLRAVLRTIATAEQGGNNGEQKSLAQKESRHDTHTRQRRDDIKTNTRPPDPKESLRSALSDVLGANNQTSQPKPISSDMPAPSTTSKHIQQVARTRQSHFDKSTGSSVTEPIPRMPPAPNYQAPPPVPAPTTPTMPEEKNVSAKELERMMRITTSDKPPLS